MFFSCADDAADAVNASGTVILDFNDSDGNGDIRLAVFIQTASLVQRADYFTVQNEETGWVWNVGSPDVFEEGGKKYVFCDNLYAPDKKIIPQGRYNVVYTDAAGNSDEAAFTLSFNDKITEVKGNEVKALLTPGNEYIAVYDQENELLYMGKKKNNWNSKKAILKEYKVAYKTRVCYSNPSNTVMCFMPYEFIEEVKTDNEG